MLKSFTLACGLLAMGTVAASAHITLEVGEASVPGAYKAVFRVGHGCAGSPTTKVRVQIPDGVIAVKPMPHAGWTIETVKGPYGKAYDYYGEKVDSGVKEVVWQGGNLPDSYYDEFVLRAYLTSDLKPGTTLYFPVIQECEQGSERWIEIPAAGKDADDYETPAPGLRLVPKP